MGQIEVERNVRSDCKVPNPLIECADSRGRPACSDQPLTSFSECSHPNLMRFQTIIRCPRHF